MLNIKKISLRKRTGAGPRDSNSRARIYVWPEGETIMDNITARRDRPWTTYKKEVLPQLFRKLGINPEKVSWSQKAGCTMCPCSPGFVVKSWDVPYDIHVTVVDHYVDGIKIEGVI